MHTIITHSGGFHSDDVFAVASLQMLLGKENTEVIRTRDEDVISRGEYVVDVGGIYDHESRRYDHHQLGAPVRENTIPYSGFGLVWKHYGVEITGSQNVAQAVEERLCQPIDAGDNGVSLYTANELGVQPFELYTLVSLFSPAWGTDENTDEAFMQAVDWARSVLERMIEKETAKQGLQTYVRQVYDAATDKTTLIFDQPVPHVTLVDYEDVKRIVCPDDPLTNENWTAACIRKSFDSFDTRVSFPREWSGLRGQELARV